MMTNEDPSVFLLFNAIFFKFLLSIFIIHSFFILFATSFFPQHYSLQQALFPLDRIQRHH
jgi:hypothetical protein